MRSCLILLLCACCGVAAAQAPALRPVPEKSVVEAELRKVRDVLRTQYAQAHTPAARLELAEELLKLGANTKDPNARYALLTESRDLAAASGNLKGALEAVRLMAGSYKVQLIQEVQTAITTTSKSIQTPEQCEEFVETTLEWVQDAADAYDYTTARGLGAMAAAAARKANSPVLQARIAERLQIVDTLRRERATIAGALDTLDRDITDPQANLQVGRFLSLAKGDWPSGLVLLARGSDPKMKALARQDLASPTTAEAQLDLADAWWDWAATEGGLAKRRSLERAAFWYRQAVDKAFGFGKARATARLKELAPAVQAVPTTASATRTERGAPQQRPNPPGQNGNQGQNGNNDD